MLDALVADARLRWGLDPADGLQVFAAETLVGTPIGKTSDPVTVAGDGTYLFKVLSEETRTPEGRQLDGLTSTAFSRWYDSKKSSVVITRDETIANSGAG